MSTKWVIISDLLGFAVKAFVLGLVLFWGLPELGVEVPFWLTAAVGVGLAVQTWLSHRIAMQLKDRAPVTGLESMVGKRCEAMTDLAPEGYVKLDGEMWIGVSCGCDIARGSKAVVVGVEGLRLVVCTTGMCSPRS